MATSTPNTPAPRIAKAATIHKLKRLPKHARIEKRPILHPAIPSPYSGASRQKVVYVSASTKFPVVRKRVIKLLDAIDKREHGDVDLFGGVGSGGGNGRGRGKGKGTAGSKRRKMAHKSATDTTGQGRGEGEENASTTATATNTTEEVVLKATGRAIKNALGFATYFQDQAQYQVRFRTGSVGVVDDIVETTGGGKDIAKPSKTLQTPKTATTRKSSEAREEDGTEVIAEGDNAKEGDLHTAMQEQNQDREERNQQGNERIREEEGGGKGAVVEEEEEEEREEEREEEEREEEELPEARIRMVSVIEVVITLR